MPDAPRSCWLSTISRRCARRACACMSCPPAPGGSGGVVQSRPRLHASLRAGRCAARCAGRSNSGAPSLGRAQVMMDFLKEWEEKLAIKITCSQARRPAQPRDHPPASLRGAAAPRLSPPRHARQRGWLSGRGGRAAASPCSRNLGRSCASVCDGVPVNLQQHIGLGASVWPLRGAERSEGCERARAAGAYPLQDSWAGAAGRHGRPAIGAAVWCCTAAGRAGAPGCLCVSWAGERILAGGGQCPTLRERERAVWKLVWFRLLGRGRWGRWRRPARWHAAGAGRCGGREGRAVCEWKASAAWRREAGDAGAAAGDGADGHRGAAEAGGGDPVGRLRRPILRA